MRYLRLWFDPHLKFHEHAKIAAAKASKATEAIRMLGNSTSSINQLCLRQIYLGAILPITTYGSMAFWDGKSSFIKTTLERAQNKALQLITRAFKTTPTSALEIEASIPPIDITLDYHTEQYATCTLRLNPTNPVMCRIPDRDRGNIPIPSPPPLPCFPPPPQNRVAAYLIRQHKLNIKKTTTTRIIRMSKLITPNAECIDPHAEPLWHRSEYDHDIQDRIRFYLPVNKPGTSAKLEWAEDHTNLYDKNKHDNDFLFVYTDSSLSYDKGTHKTGYGVVAYRNDKVLATENGTLREYVEAYDAEMKALKVASTMIHNLFNNENNPPSKIIISTNNTGAIQQIFQGSPGKDQTSLLMFCKNILDLLD